MAETSFNSKSTADEVLAGVDLTNRTILVTGCSGGIGLETMRALASHGAHVIGLARSLDSAQRACPKVDGTVTPVACDLSDLRSVEAATQFVLDQFRTVHVVVANAGITGTKERARRYGIEMQ